MACLALVTGLAIGAYHSFLIILISKNPFLVPDSVLPFAPTVPKSRHAVPVLLRRSSLPFPHSPDKRFALSNNNKIHLLRSLLHILRKDPISSFSSFLLITCSTHRMNSCFLHISIPQEQLFVKSLLQKKMRNASVHQNQHTFPYENFFTLLLSDKICVTIEPVVKRDRSM